RWAYPSTQGHERGSARGSITTITRGLAEDRSAAGFASAASSARVAGGPKNRQISSNVSGRYRIEKSPKSRSVASEQFEQNPPLRITRRRFARAGRGPLPAAQGGPG